MQISSMDLTQARDAAGTAFGVIHWARVAKRRGEASHWGARPAREVAALARYMRRIKRAMRWLPAERNERGNQVKRRHVGVAEDQVARGLERKGFRHFFSAGYTVYLVNSALRQVVTFCEGDMTEVQCASEATYEAECASILSFHGARK